MTHLKTVLHQEPNESLPTDDAKFLYAVKQLSQTFLLKPKLKKFQWKKKCDKCIKIVKVCAWFLTSCRCQQHLYSFASQWGKLMLAAMMLSANWAQTNELLIKVIQTALRVCFDYKEGQIHSNRQHELILEKQWRVNQTNENCHCLLKL